jgi:predicted nucleotidyltransferase
MKTPEEIKEILIRQKSFLRQKYAVREIGTFGSYYSLSIEKENVEVKP